MESLDNDIKRYIFSARNNIERIDLFDHDRMVLDKILDFFDDATLLTCRLVCQRWNLQITFRERLWKGRCERKGDLGFSALPPGTPSFYTYIVYHQILSGAGFQVNVHYEVPDCFYRVSADSALARTSKVLKEDWDTQFAFHFYRADDLKLCNMMQAIVFTTNGELAAANLFLWLWDRQGGLRQAYVRHIVRYIYAITQAGNIQRFWIDGWKLKSEGEIKETDGQLVNALLMRVHPKDRLILVALDNQRVCLVDGDNGQVYPLPLAFPWLSKADWDMMAEASMVESNVGMGFLSDKGLADDELAVCVYRNVSLWVAVVTTYGEVLYYATTKFSRWFSWTESSVYRSEDTQFVTLNGKYIERHSIVCTPGGITFPRLWKKAFPCTFRAHELMPGDQFRTHRKMGQDQNHARVLVSGDQFLVVLDNYDLLIYRLEDGRRIFFAPLFFNRPMDGSRRIHVDVHDATEDEPYLMARRVQMLRKSIQGKIYRGMHLIFTNLSWLDGLCMATMKSDIPVLMYVSSKNTDIKCLRWSEGIWGIPGTVKK